MSNSLSTLSGRESVGKLAGSHHTQLSKFIPNIAIHKKIQNGTNALEQATLLQPLY